MIAEKIINILDELDIRIDCGKINNDLIKIALVNLYAATKQVAELEKHIIRGRQSCEIDKNDFETKESAKVLKSLYANLKEINFPVENIKSINPLYKKTISLGSILHDVSIAFEISKQNINSERRNKRFVFARHFAFFLAREFTGHSFARIGRFFGDKDHSTVMHGADRISEMKINLSDQDYLSA